MYLAVSSYHGIYCDHEYHLQHTPKPVKGLVIVSVRGRITGMVKDSVTIDGTDRVGDTDRDRANVKIRDRDQDHVHGRVAEHP
jgi:hypothetical protein